MRLLGLRKTVGLLGSGLLGFGLMPRAAIAQSIVPVPDGTLGSEPSRVNRNVAVPGGIGTLINGGAIRGTSVFHSFSEFNVSGRTYFSGQGLDTILARVTGLNRSTIDGTLGVVGNANLFLINPRGILFGPNATLDIAGSFVASTADRINLDNGSVFSAINPNVPLLTLDVKPGLQTGVAYQGSIVNQGQLFAGRNIGLAATQIDLQPGSSVQAIKDVVLLASDSIQATGQAGSPTFIQSLVDPAIGNGAANGGNVTLIAPNITLTGQAFVRTDVLPNAGGKGGNILIQTQNLKGTGGAEVLARTVGNGDAGNISIVPLDPAQPSSVSFDGIAPFVGLDAEGLPEGGYSSGIIVSTENSPKRGDPAATGKGGFLYINGITNVSLSDGAVISGRSRSSGNGANVALDVKNLSITGGAQINVSSYKSGDPGNMVINAETITISGSDPTFLPRFKAIEAAVRKSGKTATQAFEQAQFTVDPSSESSGLFTSIYKSGKSTSASAGFILVNASSAINVSDKAKISSSVYGQSDAGVILLSTGKTYASASDLLIAVLNANDLTKTFDLGGGGQITFDNADVFSTIESGAKGNAGKIYIATGTLRLNNSAQIQTIIRGSENGKPGGSGNAGLIAVGATESVRITGTAETIVNGTVQKFGSSLLSSVGEGASGDESGVIFIRTPLLYLNDGTYITTSNFSDKGKAGYILVEADFIVLDRNSRLTSVSASGRGGNIGLQSPNLVGISRGSRITTRAGSIGKPGDGGNVVIGRDLTIDSAGQVQFNTNSPTLLTYAFPYKNSDIVANAFGRSGGRIEVSTISLRNLAKRIDTLISDDLDASSDVSGLDGIVNANSFDIDPDRGLQPMPDRFKDYRLSEGCDPSTRREDNAFRQTGSGKVATDPSDRLDLKVATRSTVSETSKPTSTQALVPELVPAIGWTTAPDGSIQMIAAQASGVALPKVPALCPT